MGKKEPKWQIEKKTVQQIKEFFSQAERIADDNPVSAQKYVQQAYKLALKTRTKIPKVLKRRFCKHCFNYFVPGKTYRVRTTGKTITYTCLNCGMWMRFGY